MTRRNLGREIAVVLAAKLVLLCGLYFLFFANRATNDAAATSIHVMGER